MKSPSRRAADAPADWLRRTEGNPPLSLCLACAQKIREAFPSRRLVSHGTPVDYGQCDNCRRKGVAQEYEWQRGTATEYVKEASL